MTRTTPGEWQVRERREWKMRERGERQMREEEKVCFVIVFLFW